MTTSLQPVVGLELDPPAPSVDVRLDGATVTVNEPSYATWRELAERARPCALNYRAAADGFLAGIVTPTLRPADVTTLPDRDRHRLMLAAVRVCFAEREWQRLYGTHLGADERFFAVMRFAFERDTKDIRARLRAAVRRRDAMPAVQPSPEDAARARKKFDEQMRKFVSPYGTLNRALFGHQKLLGTGMFDPTGGLSGAMRVLADPLAPHKGTFARIARSGMVGLELDGISKGLAFDRKLSVSGAFGVLGKDSAGLAKDLALWPTANRTALNAALGVTSPAALGLKGGALNLALGRAPKGLLERIGYGKGGAFDAAKDLGFSRLGADPLKQFALGKPFSGALDKFVEQQKAMAEMSAFVDEWAEHALWFLLSAFTMRVSGLLTGLTAQEVEDAVLDAAETVVRDGEFAPALRQAFADMTDLPGPARAWLVHALEHAEAGDWVQAAPVLLFGFEGALAHSARKRQLLARERGKFRAAEAIVKRLGFSDPFQVYLIRYVYGGKGNALRHGRAESGAREVALHGIVGIAGWAQEETGAPAFDVLVERVMQTLPHAVRRTRTRTDL